MNLLLGTWLKKDVVETGLCKSGRGGSSFKSYERYFDIQSGCLRVCWNLSLSAHVVSVRNHFCIRLK